MNNGAFGATLDMMHCTVKTLLCEQCVFFCGRRNMHTRAHLGCLFSCSSGILASVVLPGFFKVDALWMGRILSKSTPTFEIVRPNDCNDTCCEDGIGDVKVK